MLMYILNSAPKTTTENYKKILFKTSFHVPLPGAVIVMFKLRQPQQLTFKTPSRSRGLFMCTPSSVQRGTFHSRVVSIGGLGFGTSLGHARFGVWINLSELMDF